jgi:HlyD family secretion protein
VKVEDDPSAPPAPPLNPSRAERAARLSERVQSLRMPEPSHRSHSGASWFPWMLCVILAGSTAWLTYRTLISSSVPAVEQTAGTTGSATGSKSGAATETSFASSQAATKAADSDKDNKVALESKGYVIAAHQILVSPKVSGVVTRLTIEEGSRVRKGDILAELEDVDYRTDFNRFTAEMETARQKLLELERGNRPEEISQARAQLQESEAQLESLDADWKRMQQLRRTNVATASDFDLAQSKYKAMMRQVERLRFAFALMEAGARKEKIDAARADYQTAQANLEKAKWKLDNCKIRSPITGTILKKNAEEGNLVNAIAFSGSVSLCELADLSDLEVDLTVQERDISRVFKGQKCKVRAEAFPDRVYDGFVSRLMPIADRSKGAIPVRVKLSVPREEEGVYLKPEMGAIVTFYGEARPSKQKEPLASVPEPRN